MTIFSKEEILLEVKQVNLSYEKKPILRDINLTVRNITRPGIRQGQVISMVGRSGIGKTQLFRILAGLQQPTSGEILIQEKKKVKAGDMGVIFQHYYLFEWRTIQTSLMQAASKNPLLKGKEKETIQEYAGNFNLAEHLHKYPQQLSGGQRQRVSIIQQLLKGSDFLLLDEPFSGLDVIVLDKVVKLLLQVSTSDEFKTLIIVSHDIETATAISDTVFILGQEEGKPGSTIVREIDLVERDLAWKENIMEEKKFRETIEEIKGWL